MINQVNGEILDFGNLFETDGTYSEVLKKYGSVLGLVRGEDETVIEFHQRIHKYRLDKVTKI